MNTSIQNFTNHENHTIWQHACGDRNRSYHQVCLDWDVILFGDGYAGPYPDCTPQLERDGISGKKRATLRRFAEEMQPGDIVVLKLGKTDVFGVGTIVGDYEWAESFGDVDGWDLQHVRRVKWHWKANPSPRIFPSDSLKWGDTTQKLNPGVVAEWINSLPLPVESFTKDLVALPAAGSEIQPEKVAEFLYEKGVASDSISTLMVSFNELRRIAKWYRLDHKRFPSESETVAYLVIPLLRALGWTPQKMAVEWNRVDVALFDRLPRVKENLSVVVEVKKMDRSCLTARGQALGYAENKPNCTRLFVTDGMRYGIYRKKNKNFHLIAYFNLSNLRESYPIYHCAGVKEALMIMTPDWRED